MRGVKGASNKQNEMRQATISNYKFATAFNPFLLFAKGVGESRWDKGVLRTYAHIRG